MLLTIPGEWEELAEVSGCSTPVPFILCIGLSSHSASTDEPLDMQEGAMIFFRSHPLPSVSGRASAEYLLHWMKRAAVFICFTTTYFYSFTPEFSSGPCLPEHLEGRFVCFSICAIMSTNLIALYPSPVFVKQLKNAMS